MNTLKLTTQIFFNLIVVNFDRDRTRLLGVEFDYNEVSSLVLEYISGEPLDKYVHRNKRLNEKTIKLFIRQTVDAVGYMHSKLVMHRLAFRLVLT